MNKTEMKEKIQDLESQLQDLKDVLEIADWEIPEGQLCWFWDEDDTLKPVMMSYKRYRQSSDKYCHVDVNASGWEHARPVTPEEVRKMMPMFPEMQSISKGTLYDWSNIDTPYKYMARDGDGKLYAYKNCPIWDDVKKEWVSVGDDNTTYNNTPGYVQFQGSIVNSPINPKDSLEKRPGV